MSLSSFNETFDSELETCISRLTAQGEVNNDTTMGHLCGVVWDGFNCWGPANPSSTVYLACPAAKGMDVRKQAYRYCDASGHWLNRDGVADEKGWTNYTPCFTPEIFTLIKRLYSGSESEAMSKIDIARRTRMLELCGLSLSFMALLISLFIFYYFRSLRNPRTRLHRHLFIAMVIQVTVRLTLYIDQFIVRANLDEKTLSEQQYARGIDNTPILCEAAYICLEYARTAMFMWMFVEGLYLHNMITVTVFEEKLSPSIYPLVGWVFPIPLTLSWAIVTAKHYGTATCWWGYNFTLYFWILEGPRLGVLMVNLAFLLNILRVLVTKLRQSNSSEAQQARKAVKAALVLLPLLGLTNLLNMLDAPLERSAVIFGLWSYVTHTLTSCQGLILAFLYCFWNGEVQLALKKFVRYKIFNGSKYRGSGNGRGSVRMSLMNNTSAAGRTVNNAILVQQSTRNGTGTSTKPHVFQLSPVKSNNIDANRLNIDANLPIPTLDQLTPDNNMKLLEESTSDVNNSVSCNSTLKVSGISKNSAENSTCGGGKLRRFSKLRIWISPFNISGEAKKRNSESSITSPKNKYGPEDETDERVTSNMSSAEGCHFQIEVLEDVQVK